jgi:hypothetical protein
MKIWLAQLISRLAGLMSRCTIFFFVSVIQAVGNLDDQLNRLLQCEFRFCQLVGQILAVDVFGNNKQRDDFRAPHMEHRDDLFVIQARHHLGLGQVVNRFFCIGDAVQVWDFDGHPAIKSPIERQKHIAKTTTSQLTLNPILANHVVRRVGGVSLFRLKLRIQGGIR